MKISIFSFAVNDKFPIDIMHRQFSKFLKEDFDFVLFNDAYDPQIEKNINTIAEYNKISCVNIPQNIHRSRNPSDEYAASLNWAIHEYAPKNGCEIVVLLHTDVFPICDVLISEIIGNHMAASTVEFRLLNGKPITYFYPAFTIVNMRLLKDPSKLDFGVETGLDCGGKTKEFIANNADSVKFIVNHQISYIIATLEADDPFAKYLQGDLDICRSHGLSAGWIAEGFYHYMAGSQWNGGNPTFADGHKKRMDLFLSYFY